VQIEGLFFLLLFEQWQKRRRIEPRDHRYLYEKAQLHVDTRQSFKIEFFSGRQEPIEEKVFGESVDGFQKEKAQRSASRVVRDTFDGKQPGCCRETSVAFCHLYGVDLQKDSVPRHLH
jgi:uncharacterized protein YdaU (DUF1376 family)